MTSAELRLGYSMISNSIYCGTVSKLKSGQLVWKSKQDVTSDFLSVIVQMMSTEENRKGMYIGTETNPKEFVLTMKKVEEEDDNR